MSDIKRSDGNIEVFLLLGSNIHPEVNIPLAIKKLKEKMRVAIISSIWETRSDKISDPNFLNCIVKVITNLSLDEIKKEIVRPIEDQLYRVRTENKNAPRSIDIDIILYGDLEVDTTLWEHVYIAVPLAELHPNYVNKKNNQKLSDAAEKLKGRNFILKRSDIKE